MTVSTLRALPITRRASALYCDLFGRGTPVLLLHDLGNDGSVFRPLIDQLAKNHLVIVPDLRGHGRSSRLQGTNSVARMSADVRNLLDLTRIPSCFVLGYGAGGAVAQQLAHDDPKRVRGLLLVCAYARKAPALIGRLEQGLRRLAARGKPGDTLPAANAAPGAAQFDQALTAFDSRPWLRELHCPALVVAGGTDVTTPVTSARELAHGLRLADLQIIPNAGHGLVQTHADELLQIVLPWLATHEAAA